MVVSWTLFFISISSELYFRFRRDWEFYIVSENPSSAGGGGRP
jgi:hypothetical protein